MGVQVQVGGIDTMKHFAYGVAVAAFTPFLTVLLVFDASTEQFVAVASATIAAILFAWVFFSKRNDESQAVISEQQGDLPYCPVPLPPCQLAGAVDGIQRRTREPGQALAVAIKRAGASPSEIDVSAHKSDWLHRQQHNYNATILVSDLRGFTTISETYTAGEIVNILNHYFDEMSKIIYRYNGAIDKLMGDSILAEFGGPDRDLKEDALNAISCAAEMQIAMYKFNRDNQNLGMPALYMGIGINTGDIVSSRLGSELYNEHTIIGNTVNEAARIESSTVRGQVLISESTYTLTWDHIDVNDPMEIIVKGKREPMLMYELESVNGPEQLKVPERDIRRSPRVDVDIPFRFHVCEGKIIASEECYGRVSNISTGGMLVYTSTKVEPYFYIRFRFDFDVFGMECDDIYGKVLRVVKCEEGYELSIEFTIIDSWDRHSIQDLVNSTLASGQHR